MDINGAFIVIGKYLSKGIGNSRSIGLTRDGRGALHLRNGGSSSRHNVGEASNDLLCTGWRLSVGCVWSRSLGKSVKLVGTYREGALTDNDEGSVDDGNALSWSLQLQ